jgi:hypothetical protein
VDDGDRMDGLNDERGLALMGDDRDRVKARGRKIFSLPSFSRSSKLEKPKTEEKNPNKGLGRTRLG